MGQLFKFSMIVVIFFAFLRFFGWLFGANLSRINECLYYSLFACVILFGINLLFGFKNGR